MIALLIQQDQIQIEMRGSEDKILEELSTAIVRMMKAIEESGGAAMKENLSFLTLKTIDKSRQEESHEENTYFV